MLRRSLFATSMVSVLALSVSGSAFAADLVIPSGTTAVDPILTSTADGGAPGNVIINVGGAVTLDTSYAAGTAITIDSNAATVNNSGAILAAFADQSGIIVSTATSGGIVNAGSIRTGTAPDPSAAIPTDAIGGGPAVLVQEDLGKGIDNTGTISSVSSSTNPYAVLIETSGSSVALGQIGGGTTVAIRNGGTISVVGYDVLEAPQSPPTLSVALGLKGNTGAAEVLTVDGIDNDAIGSVIRATATESSAIGVDVGDNVMVNQGLSNAGTIQATVASETAASLTATAVHVGANGTLATIDNKENAVILGSTSGTVGGNAFGIDVDAAGTLPSITNAGTIQAIASTDGTSATAIRDQSGTLTNITNASTGVILGSGTATGRGIALDLTGGNTTIANAGAISGEILLNGGAYTINSTAGTVVSAITIDGLATADINLTGTTIMKASSTLTSGALNLNVGTGATFNAAVDDFNATDVTFDGGSTYGIAYDPSTLTQSGKIVTGTATFHDGSIVDVTLQNYLNDPTTLTVVESASMIAYDTPGTPGVVIGGIGAGYDAVFTTPNAGDHLAVTLSRKSAASLGLSDNAASLYNAAGPALALDAAFGSAVGNLATVGAVANVYNQMLPDLSSARERMAIRMQDIAGGFVDDRLNIMRTAEQGVGDGGGKYYDRYRRAGLWAQQAFSTEKGEGSIGTQDYDGTLYALALGYDWRDTDGDVWGGSLTYSAMSYSAGTTMSDNLAQTTMAQIYRSINRGPFFWDTMGSVAMNSYDTDRVVTAGAVARKASGSWTGYQAGASTQVGYAAVFGGFTVRPSIGAAYTFLSQEGYSEERGGTGVDLAIDSSTFQSFRGNAQVRISQIFSSQPQYVPYLRAGLSHEFLTDQPKVTGHFVSSGSGFSLQGDELDKDIPFVGAGLAVVGGYSRLSLEYTGQLGSKVKSHQIVATASLMF